MKIPQVPRIGGRIWKTGVAVALSLVICKIFNIPEPVFAGVAAVICMQPTVLATLRKGRERLQATVIGAAIGLGMIALVSYYPHPLMRSIAAGAAVIAVSWLCLLFKWMDALVLAAATVVVVMVHSEEQINITVYAVERTLVTAIGVVTASFVNAFMYWPNVEYRFPKRLPEIASLAFSEFESAVMAFRHRDLAAVKSALDSREASQQTFKQASSELTWFAESYTVRQKLPLAGEEVSPLLSEMFFLLESIHQEAYRILEDTQSIYEDRPDYVLHDAQVYQIIEDALLSASGLREAILHSLQTGDCSALKDNDQGWSTELHSQFIRYMRAAHKSPKDLFPLFEVARVGIELRSYIRSLLRIRSILLEHKQVLSSLHRYR